MRDINLAEEILFKNDKINDDSVCFRSKKTTLKYKELKSLIYYYIEELNKENIDPENRVIVMMDETPLFTAIFYSLISLGAVPIVINPKFDKENIEYILNDSKANLIITDLELNSDQYNHKIYFIDKDFSINELIIKGNFCSNEIIFYRNDGKSEAIIQYTSGSTGNPKGVLHCANRILACCETVSRHFMIQPDDIIYSVSKTFFGFGMGNTLLFPIYNGASAILDIEWPNINNIKNNLNQFKPTILCAVPSVFEQLIQIDFDCHLRIALSSGSHLSIEIAKKWRTRFNLELLNGIGATELLHLFAANKLDSNKLGSVGKLLEGCKVKIINEDDQEITTGETGRLLIQSPTLALGCSKNGVVSKFDEPWYPIGDLFSMDDEGYLYFHGRTDDRFKINGRWVTPLEVENKILSKHTLLDQCYVTCIQDEHDYDSVVLFIIGQKNLAMLDQLEEINQSLPNYQKINHIVLLEQIPVNSNGKLDRKQFKKIAAEYLLERKSDSVYVSPHKVDQASYEHFIAQNYNLTPLWKKIKYLNDFSVELLFKKIKRDHGSFLFETYQNAQDKYIPHYTVIGLDTQERIEIYENKVRSISQNCINWEKSCTMPLIELKKLQHQFKVPKIAELPEFCGGYFGYFGFETTRLIEPRLNKKPKKNTDLPIADIVQIQAKELVVIDHTQREIYCITHAVANELGQYHYAKQQCDFISNRIVDFFSQYKSELTTQAEHQKYEGSEDLFYCLPRENFLENVSKIKEYIKSGDVMQVVLSQRMHAPLNSSALDYYLALKKLAHTPYTYYIDLIDFQIVGASPEELVKLTNNKLISRPMAGTRKRTGMPSLDKALEHELLSDAKEKCEHMMLVDLARNDVGRLALPGSVTVDELMKVEFYSHVMHIVSTVTAPVSSDVTGLDALVATFPAGTLSGASKIRALEIIAELEPHPRGVYGGVIGYINWHGQADLAIAIRTSLIKDQKIYIQAGAGIVNDSIAENEWQETIDKSSLLLIAAQNANAMNMNNIKG